jgi:hypothetical protein
LIPFLSRKILLDPLSRNRGAAQNLAGIYTATKDLDTSIELLKAELHILNHTAHRDEFLVCQARLHLAQALAGDERLGADRAAEATEHLENIAVFTQGLALEPSTQKAASHFCTRSLDILRRVKDAGHAPRMSQPLEDIFVDVLARLPETWDAKAQAAAQLASNFLSAGHADQAEAACRPYVTPLVYGDNLQLELQRLLIEALAVQAKWQETKAELSALGPRLGNHPLHRGTAQDTLHNTGFPVAIAALLGDQLAAELLSYLMLMPCFASIRRAPEPSYRAKFSVLGLALAVVENSPSGISRYLSEVQESSISDPALVTEHGWLLLAVTAINFAGQTQK